MTGFELMLAKKDKYMQHADAFYRTFGVRLKPYFSFITGFDVIAFDEKVIKPEDGESTAQKIERVYGTEAVTLIERLIHA